MMDDRHNSRTGELLQAMAFVLIVATLTARPFLQEMTYRSSPLPAAVFNAELRSDEDTSTWQVDRTELARVTFAMILLGAVALWLLGAAIKKQGYRHVWLGVLIVAFAVWAYFCTLHASDRRSAMDVWLEQVSLLAACWVAAQLFADRRRFAMLIVVLAGVGAAMAYKGIYQVTVELPETVKHFEMYGDGMGIEAGSSQAKMFESRLRSSAPTGFFALSNLYASAIIIMLTAAAGLAFDKFVAAGRSRQRFRTTRKSGEVHLPTVAALLSAAVVPALLAVLLLTRSRGGIAAGLLAIGAFVCVGIWRRQLAKHWRKIVIAAAAAFVLCVGATVAYGLKNDRLPTRTLTFRWHYWTGAAEVVRENPVWGAGPGNFHTAYLQHRRLGAEEAVKLPHNVIVHAATQFGLPGAAMFLLILGGVMVGICRPKTDKLPDHPHDHPTSHAMPLIIFAVMAMFAARMIFSNLRGDGIAAMLNGIPAMVLLVGLLIAAWAGGKLLQPAVGNASRIALACGLGGFVLHNMVTFSFWTPATAMLFWVTAGACLAQGYQERPIKLKFIRWPVALAFLFGWLAVLVVAYLPVFGRVMVEETVTRAVKRDNSYSALLFSRVAHDMDSSDPIASADAARLRLLFLPPPNSEDYRKELEYAFDDAKDAINSDPANAGFYTLAARIAEQIKPGSELEYLADAVSRDPQSMSIRLTFAEQLGKAARKAECLAQLDVIERIDAALMPESLLHLTDAQRAKIKELRDQFSVEWR